jgi:hypothetical protein
MTSPTFSDRFPIALSLLIKHQTKCMLCLALVFMSIACYIFFLEGSNCFVAFELTDTIAVALDGNALNLVKTLGWMGIGLFTASCILLKLYYVKTAKIMQGLKDGTLQHKNKKLTEMSAQHRTSPTAISNITKKAIV